MTGPSLRSIAAGILLGALTAHAGDVPPPALAFARDHHEFGAVRQGDVVETGFAYENRGLVPLTISPPITACDCRATIVGAADIAPGDRGEIRVSCDTARVSGSLRRTVTIHSSEVTRRSILLSITGDVSLDVITDPPQVYLGQVLRGQHHAGTFTAHLGSDGTRSTAIRAVDTTGEHIDVDWQRGDVLIHLSVRDDAPLGAFSQSVTLETNSQRIPAWNVPVSGIVVEALPAGRW